MISLQDLCPHSDAHPCDVVVEWQKRKLHAFDEIIPILDDVVRLLEAADYGTSELFAIRLAVEEALVNAIKHGHRGDLTRQVQLRYYLAPECFLIEVEDEGPGFRPQEVPDPLALENLERSCGRGLLLMRHYMTWVRFNERGNCVTMCRRHSRS